MGVFRLESKHITTQGPRGQQKQKNQEIQCTRGCRKPRGKVAGGSWNDAGWVGTPARKGQEKETPGHLGGEGGS